MASISSIFSRIREFTRECIRVLKVTKKPTNMEFKTIVKMSGLGIAIIGLVGFLITIISQIFGGIG